MIIEIDSIFSFRQFGERENQEDSRYPDNDRPSIESSTFVVCDGVGGCDKGEVASATVCEKIGELMSHHKSIDDFTDTDFKHILDQSYKALDEVSDESNLGMGTTLTFLSFHSEGAMAAHIGDSRIYQIRPGEGIIYRSEDHSLVNALLRSGNLSPDKVKDHPKGNVITRCMCADNGIRQRDDATVANLRDIAPGDYFLLCTDGVTGKVDDEELIDLYSSDKSDEDKYLYLADKCNDSTDNNTAIQIHIGLVTIDLQPESSDESSEEETENVRTQKIEKKEDSVHELSVEPEKWKSKFKSFFNKIFK